MVCPGCLLSPCKGRFCFSFFIFIFYFSELPTGSDAHTEFWASVEEHMGDFAVGILAPHPLAILWAKKGVLS